jgi:hypothetical protein
LPDGLFQIAYPETGVSGFFFFGPKEIPVISESRARVEPMTWDRFRSPLPLPFTPGFKMQVHHRKPRRSDFSDLRPFSLGRLEAEMLGDFATNLPNTPSPSNLKTTTPYDLELSTCSDAIR